MRFVGFKMTVLTAAWSCAVVGQAATITSTFSRTINDNGSDEPWFTPSGGSVYEGSIASGGGSTSSVTGTGLIINGSSSLGSGFADGNGIPDGVTIQFDVSFNITATAGTNATLVDGGNNGLAINSDLDAIADRLEPGEQLAFSAISFSNVMITADSNGYLMDNSVILDNARWTVLRSNDFGEVTEGATVSSDAAVTTDVSGFGTSGNGAINNNFSDGTFGPLSQVFITADAGDLRIKGIGYQFDATVNAIPEPGSVAIALLTIGSMTMLRLRRR